MADLLLKNHAPDRHGLVHRVTPESAGWGHVGFELYRLKAGQSLAAATAEREACLVLVGGKARVQAGGRDFGEIGQRMGPFEGKKPVTVYVPWHSDYRIEATTDLELGVCSAPGGGDHGARVIGPDQVAYSVRGQGSNTRHVYDILPETEPAHSLLVVEVITPAGGWSSYPSHKHDTDDLPHESASTRPRASRSSGSIPTTARWMRPCASTTATSRWCPRAITRAAPRTAINCTT